MAIVMRVVYDLTSSQSMRAFITIVFSLVAAFLILNGDPVPDVVLLVLGPLLGFYFADKKQGNSKSGDAL